MEFGKLDLGCRFTLYLDSKIVYIKTSDTEAVVDRIHYKFGIILNPTDLVHTI